MTGAEFRAHLKRIGLTQRAAAQRLGVDEDTMTARCRDEAVPSLYVYALLGLAAEALQPHVAGISELIGEIAE